MCVSRDSTADEKSKNDTGVRIGLLVARRKKYSRQRMTNCSEDFVKSEPPPASAKIQPDLSNPGSVISPVAGRRVDFFRTTQIKNYIIDQSDCTIQSRDRIVP